MKTPELSLGRAVFPACFQIKPGIYRGRLYGRQTGPINETCPCMQ